MGQHLAWRSAEGAGARESAPLVVYEISDRAALGQLEAEWNGLVEETTRQLFHRFELTALWLRHFAPEARLRVLVAREPGGRLAAVLPLMEKGCSVLGAEVLQLVSPADWHAHRCDLVARQPKRAARAFLEWLNGRADWDVVRVFNVPEGGGAFELETTAKELGLSVGSIASVRSPYLKLPATVEALEASLKSSLRANLRRRRRRLDERGTVTVERVERGEQVHRLLDEALALETRGWKGREGTAIAQSAKTEGFYRELAELAEARGWLALYALRVDGRLIAFDFGLAYEGTYASFKTAYDEAFSQVSPGQLLTLETLRDCVRRGLTEVDLLGDEDSAKSQWTSTSRPHSSLVLFRSRLLGETIYARNNPWLPKVWNRVMGWAR